MNDKRNVAQHYDQRKEQTRDQRCGNAAIQLKLLNNLLKRALLCEATSRFPAADHPLLTIVDLCGGKAGDIQKWVQQCLATKQRIRYMLLDASAGEVQRAQRRFNELSSRERECFQTASFLCLDAFNFDAVSRCVELAPFAACCDIVSCQFALHYAYENEAKSNGFWRVVDWLSSRRSILALSYPSRQRIIEWCRGHAVHGDGGIDLDNGICGVCFADPRLEKLICQSTLQDALHSAPQYGACYRFSLRDSLHQVPEFLMPSNCMLHEQAAALAHYRCCVQTTVDQLLSSDNNIYQSDAARAALREAAQVVVSSAEYEVACLYQYSLYERNQVACASTIAAAIVPEESLRVEISSINKAVSEEKELPPCKVSVPENLQSTQHEFESASKKTRPKKKDLTSALEQPRRSRRLQKE